MMIAGMSPFRLQAQTAKPATDIESRIEELLTRMTLAEKLGQMTQVTVTDNMYEMRGMIRAGMIGSYINIHDRALADTLQRIALTESRLGIPLLMARDVIHGYNTIFPIPLGQAATWDAALVEQGARISATEASSDGIRWTFSPMLDISRDPRWGRIVESYGEDPYLTTTLGTACIRGLQGSDLSDATSLAACAKHFVAYGAAEGGRDYNSTFIGERRLRDVYFPPFEAAVQAGAATFMTSFNDNDGIPSVASHWLHHEVLRDEWHFDGLVVSDWQAINELEPQGYASDLYEAVTRAVHAGVEMDMMGYGYLTHLDSMVRSGQVDQLLIDQAVRDILRVKFRLGLFDQPYATTSPSVKYAPEHLAAARAMAAQSAILLKNDNDVLPLSRRLKRIAIVGPMADAPHDQMGTWSFDGDKSHTITPLKALRETLENHAEILYTPGLTYSRDSSQTGISQAVATALQADVVIAFVGEEAILSGEAHSLADLRLQGRQTELLEQLSQTGRPLITVVMTGHPLPLERESACSDALLLMFHPGTMGGPALADLLTGQMSPCGRLPVTLPRTVGQIPIYYAYNNTCRPSEGNDPSLADIPLEAGQTSTDCNSRYLDYGTAPLYPFGYGLGYTHFAYGTPHTDTAHIAAGDTLHVAIDITNTGRTKGIETVQLYTGKPAASVVQPVKELRAFQRVTLSPGETRRVTFALPTTQLAFTGVDMKRRIEPGRYLLWVAPDSSTGERIEFFVHAP